MKKNSPYYPSLFWTALATRQQGIPDKIHNDHLLNTDMCGSATIEGIPLTMKKLASLFLIYFCGCFAALIVVGLELWITSRSRIGEQKNVVIGKENEVSWETVAQNILEELDILHAEITKCSPELQEALMAKTFKDFFSLVDRVNALKRSH